MQALAQLNAASAFLLPESAAKPMGPPPDDLLYELVFMRCTTPAHVEEQEKKRLTSLVVSLLKAQEAQAQQRQFLYQDERG